MSLLGRAACSAFFSLRAPGGQAARLSWSGLLSRAAAVPSLGRVTFQTGRMVTSLSGTYRQFAHKLIYGTWREVDCEGEGAIAYLAVHRDWIRMGMPAAGRSV